MFLNDFCNIVRTMIMVACDKLHWNMRVLKVKKLAHVDTTLFRFLILNVRLNLYAYTYTKLAGSISFKELFAIR